MLDGVRLPYWVRTVLINEFHTQRKKRKEKYSEKG